MSSPLDRHEKVALLYSGGKDSTAVVELLRESLDRLTIYHLDTGDLLPEMAEAVQRVELSVPNFIRVQTDVAKWINQHGLPSDLMPYHQHKVGQMMGQHGGVQIVSRYDCCWANLMGPLIERVHADGNTLVIRGTKAADMPMLPLDDGQIGDGLELWLPIRDWSNEDVFAFLNARGIPMPRIYAFVANSPECARCPAWWGEQRNTYLKRFYPHLWNEYQSRLRVLAGAVMPSFAAFMREWEGTL